MLASIRESASIVTAQAQHVSICTKAIREQIKQSPELWCREALPSDWAEDYHFFDPSKTELSLRYILVLDALNFSSACPSFHYDHLARALGDTAKNQPEKLDPTYLKNISSNELCSILFPNGLYNNGDAQLDERVRLVREVGSGLVEYFNGSVLAFVKAANHNAAKLVELVLMYFPGFRDAAIYNGNQVFIYKRAQIFVADIFAAFKGIGIGMFTDIAGVTCFADYRVPQLLEALGVLVYSSELKAKVVSGQDIPAGGQDEVEIRCASICAVELFKSEIASMLGQELLSLEVDWLVWGRGELLAQKSELPPHHETKTIFY